MAADASDDQGRAAADATTNDREADRRAAARPRPSLTIDLTAEDVSPAPGKTPGERPEPADRRAEPGVNSGSDSDAPQAGQVPPGAAAGGLFGGVGGTLTADDTFRRGLLAGVIGGVAALVVLLLLQSIGLLPAPGRSAARQAAEQATAAAKSVAALDRRLTAVETATEPVARIDLDLKALSDKVTALDAIRPAIASRGDVETLAATVAALGKRVDGSPPPATRDELSALADRIGRLEAAAAAGGEGQATGSAALTSLATQLNQAEADVRALSDRVAAAEARTAGPGDPDAVRAVAVAALRRASADGKPFAAEVDMVASLGIAGSDIGIVRPLAAKGVAPVADVQAEFPGTADAILAATAAPLADANFFQRALAGLGKLVQVRPIGPVAGSDPAAIVSRMSDDVAKGNFAAAVAERRSLPRAGQDASADWAAKAADRDVLDRAVERIADAAAVKAG